MHDISRCVVPTATPGAATRPLSPLGIFSLHIWRGRDRRKDHAAPKRFKSGGVLRRYLERQISLVQDTVPPDDCHKRGTRRSDGAGDLEPGDKPTSVIRRLRGGTFHDVVDELQIIMPHMQIVQ